MAEYVYKYLFSISPSTETSSLVGMCLLSGKEFDRADLIDAREKERSKSRKIQAWILPLTETKSSEDHNKAIEALIESVLKD